MWRIAYLALITFKERLWCKAHEIFYIQHSSIWRITFTNQPVQGFNCTNKMKLSNALTEFKRNINLLEPFHGFRIQNVLAEHCLFYGVHKVLLVKIFSLQLFIRNECDWEFLANRLNEPFSKACTRPSAERKQQTSMILCGTCPFIEITARLPANRNSALQW